MPLRWARLWRLPRRCARKYPCCYTNHTAVAIISQPLDRLHSHVARVHCRRCSWPSTTGSPTCTTTAAGSSGRRATRVLRSTSGFRDLLPSATSGSLSCLVAMDARGPRQCLQHRHSHPATELLELGDRRGCFLSHHRQPWWSPLCYPLPFLPPLS